jgi:S1-C subfamily serine protease
VAVTARVGGDQVESSGVVLDADRGLILTTAHDVWGARSLKVSTGIAVLHGRIVARDSCDDLAVLETQPRLPGLVAVQPSADGALFGGRPVIAVRRRSGLPSRAPDLDTHRGVVGETPARVLPGVRPEGAVTLAGAALPASATGSPLLGSDGRLAGLALIVPQPGGGTNRVALPWETINARMAELEAGGRAEYVGWRRHYRCAGAMHRYALASHPGYRHRDAQMNAPVPATRLPGTEELDG